MLTQPALRRCLLNVIYESFTKTSGSRASPLASFLHRAGRAWVKRWTGEDIPRGLPSDPAMHTTECAVQAVCTHNCSHMGSWG